MLALPLELLVQIFVTLEEPPSRHFFASSCMRSEDAVDVDDEVCGALEECEREATRLRSHGVWDTVVLSRVAAACDALMERLSPRGVSNRLSVVICTRDDFDKSVVGALRDVRALVETHYVTPAPKDGSRAAFDAADVFTVLIGLARALQETTLAPSVAVVCSRFARALDHPHAVQTLWRPWAWRRWSQLTLLARFPAMPPAYTVDWRAYAQRRLRLRGAAASHVVDNCFAPECPLTREGMLDGTRACVPCV